MDGQSHRCGERRRSLPGRMSLVREADKIPHELPDVDGQQTPPWRKAHCTYAHGARHVEANCKGCGFRSRWLGTGGLMKLAKPCVDPGLNTNNLEPMLQFWQSTVGLAFDHV